MNAGLMAVGCPCFLFGLAKQLLGESLVGNILVCVLSGCPTLVLCSFRETVRVQYNIVGDCLDDCIVSCLCSCCTLSQIYRQLKQVPPSKKPSVHPEWSSGLFDCLTDPPSILLVIGCICLAFGTLKKKMGQNKLGQCIFGLFCLNPVIIGCQNRGVLRARYNIRSGLLDSVVGDFWAWALFPCCALSQELRHVKKYPFLVHGVSNQAH